MCEYEGEIYYTLDGEEYSSINEDVVLNAEHVILSTAHAKNKIIDHREQRMEIELINYSYLTLKQLNMICDYYGIASYIRTAKCKKEDIVNMLVQYENTEQNYDIVVKRKRMWKYLEELKNDAYMKKFIIMK